MKKVLVLLMLTFIVLGYSNTFPLLAQEDVNADNESNTASIDNEVPSNNGDLRPYDSKRPGEVLRERIKNKLDESNGTLVRKVDKRYIDEEGNEVRVQRRIMIHDGELEVRTRLKVEGEGANFTVVKTNGEIQRIRVPPERLRQMIIERLHANNVTNLSLDEITDRNVPRVVYRVASEHPGRFLGIFRLAMKAETQVDPETGEVLDVKTPWWAFLVAKDLAKENVVGNETVAEEVVANETELEAELGGVSEEVEIEEGVIEEENATA